MSREKEKSDKEGVQERFRERIEEGCFMAQKRIETMPQKRECWKKEERWPGRKAML